MLVVKNNIKFHLILPNIFFPCVFAEVIHVAVVDVFGFIM